MAKHSTVKTSGPARVRLIVLDAELPDGDLASLTQALQNALRSPAPAVVQRVATTNGSKAISHQLAPEEVEIDTEQEVEEPAEAATITRQSHTKRSVPRAPKVIDIEMNAPVSLATFAQGKELEEPHKKFMIAAAWLKEHRGIDAVTAGHIYTCFKSMGWSTNIPDFGAPLRYLKAKLQYFGKSDKGYEINHIGLDHVKKLGGNDGAG